MNEEESKYRLMVVTHELSHIYASLGTIYYQPQWKDDEGNWHDYIADPIHEPDIPVQLRHKEDAVAFIIDKKQRDSLVSNVEISYIYF